MTRYLLGEKILFLMIGAIIVALPLAGGSKSWRPL